MTSYADLALLPEGLHDDLPPTAQREAEAIEQLVDCCAANGFERVKPPLIEFEESLLSGPGAGVSRHMFRLMDPISQRMMGLRADMTTQVARIASTRLAKAPRPLRLCYAGQVLRVRGSQLRPERQFAQAGVELIGVDVPAADAEVVLLAAEALAAVGVESLTIDLTVPSLVPLLAQELGLEGEAAEQARKALDARDGAAVAALPDPTRAFFAELMATAGRAEDALGRLDRMTLPEAAAPLIGRLGSVVQALRRDGNGLSLTVDPGESRGFEYQTGVSFTLLGRGVRGELGRGGRYDLVTGETATGFTLYMDSVMRAVPEAKPAPRVFLPYGTLHAAVAALHTEGWRTVRGLDEGAKASDEARRLGCSHILQDGRPQALAAAKGS